MYSETYMQRAGANCCGEAGVGSAERHTVSGNGDTASNDSQNLRTSGWQADVDLHEMSVRRCFLHVANNRGFSRSGYCLFKTHIWRLAFIDQMDK
jgi:hypothetical protein